MRAFIVAEIASNWEGSLTTAKKLIRESKKSGADAVKFQMWRASDLYKTTHPNWKQIKNSSPSDSFSYCQTPDLRILPHVYSSGCMKLCNCSLE